MTDENVGVSDTVMIDDDGKQYLVPTKYRTNELPEGVWYGDDIGFATKGYIALFLLWAGLSLVVLGRYFYLKNK